ncbi:MAG: tRNA uridine-5-carboxymethylaminomethyl(34) synthesis GTPase MnmE [Lentisphaerae bacterium]|nr:tRNA uridine-5-carboxymethylaminomethyl(34) synthesis GTPase MnmE [Lentisphaerota bacterium]
MTAPDTIAAISTAAGKAGIAIVRLSGPDSLRIADRLCRCPHPPPSQRAANSFVRAYIHAGATTDGEWRDMDEVIVLVYRAPHSYTREDVVEIQGHGGRVSAQRILGAVLGAGARLAEPGEFTRRAFLNGRIDLLQAEAVADLISARSERAASAALEQIEGRLSGVFADSYNVLMSVAVELETTLDFVEHDVAALALPSIRQRLDEVRESLEKTLSTWEEGHLLREGALVVICGRPNVGKSTLLNTLLGKDRAIVTDTPGTTRDTLEEGFVLDGIPVRLVDTAGLRKSDCEIEREGVRRAQMRIDRADAVVYVVDGAVEPEDEDHLAINEIPAGKCLVLLNKTDLGCRVSAEEFPDLPVVSCCLLKHIGLEDISKGLLKLLGVKDTPPHATISERHKVIVQSALNGLNEAAALLGEGREDLHVPTASVLRDTLEALGTLTGRSYSTELLDNIFSRFCIGK